MKLKKIKICHIADQITGTADGVFSQLMVQFKYLELSGYEQYLVFPGNTNIERQLNELNINYFVVPELKNKIPIIAFLKIILFVKRKDIGIIHTHFLKPYIIGGLISLITQKKAIFNYHGLFIDNLYYNSFEKFLYRAFHRLIDFARGYDVILTPSKTSALILQKEIKITTPIQHYYLGANESQINIYLNQEIVTTIQEKKKQFFIIGVVARVDIAKRIDIAIKILKTLLDRNHKVFLFVIGDGNLLDKMIKLIEILGVSNNVKLLGYIPNAKGYIKFFDVLLLTSAWEGFPIVIWESMISKTPIYSSNVGGINEIIETEKCGHTFPFGDIEKAASLIEVSIKSKTLKEELGNNGYYAATHKYSTDNFINQMSALYSSLIFPSHMQKHD